MEGTGTEMKPKQFLINVARFTEKSDNIKIRVSKKWITIDLDDGLRIVFDGFKNVEIIDETNVVK